MKWHVNVWNWMEKMNNHRFFHLHHAYQYANFFPFSIQKVEIFLCIRPNFDFMFHTSTHFYRRFLLISRLHFNYTLFTSFYPHKTWIKSSFYYFLNCNNGYIFCATILLFRYIYLYTLYFFTKAGLQNFFLHKFDSILRCTAIFSCYKHCTNYYPSF